MSELPYAYQPDLLPPVFEGAPLPLRSFQVRTVINDSLFMRSDSLPEALGMSEERSIEDAVREFEALDEPTEVKDGRLLGLVAAMTERALAEGSTLDKWQLAPHIAMLNAVGAALSAGLPVSEEALRLAAGFHEEYSGRESGAADPYDLPGGGPVVRAVKQTMTGYGSMDLIRNERGVGRYLSYYLYDIDKALYDLPVTAESIGIYETDEELRPLVAAHGYLTSQVAATRNALLEKEAELNDYLNRVYERIEASEAAR